MVYGAWANNPVPLTEAATLRPSSSHPAIVGLAEAERLAAQLADDHPDLDVAVLRPTVTVHPDRAAWLAASPWSARGLLVGDVEPPAQYLHRDDLVSAIALVALEGHSGAFNVAPDGWLGAEQVRELAGPRPRAGLPAEAAEQLRALRWQFDRTGTSPELAPWVRHPWVVSSDRLRALGWVPRHRNEEVFVEATPPGRFGELDAGARQRLALGVIGAVVVGAGVAGVAILRWRRRVNGRRG